MIIKSMSAKAGSANFGRLINYMLKPGAREKRPEQSLIKHNMLSPESDPAAITAEFEQNASYRRRRANGVVLYHEVISPHPKDGHLVSDELLEDIGRVYMAMRAEEGLAVAAIHRDLEDQDRPHLHICISGNKIESDRQLRLTRQRFRQVQREMEEYQRQHYPELVHSIVFDQEREPELDGLRRDHLREAKRRQNREVQMGRRLREQGKLSRKEQVRAQVGQCVAAARDADELKRLLANLGLAYYERGNSPAVMDINTGKRYRLKTLGLADDLDARRRQWQAEKDREERVKERKAELERVRRERGDGGRERGR